MQTLTIDTGMQEYLINNRAVLRFNPSDPNLYHRFFAAAPKLDALDAELTEQLKALPAKPDDARAERGLALLTDYDHRIKALLTEIFGGENDFDKVLDEFDAVIGLERLACMHINDSKNVQGARKDRHANIGFGEIGFEKLNAIVHNERVKDVVKILETPYVEDHPPYRQEIAMLRSGVFDEQIMEKIKGDI